MKAERRTAVLLLLFATALSALLTIGIPIAMAPEPVKLSDWLGFAGSFLGAIMTLIAAVYAWQGVQAQIDALREATAIALVSREEDRLEREYPALERASFLCEELTSVLMQNQPQGLLPAMMSAGLSDKAEIYESLSGVPNEIRFALVKIIDRINSLGEIPEVLEAEVAEAKREHPKSAAKREAAIREAAKIEMNAVKSDIGGHVKHLRKLLRERRAKIDQESQALRKSIRRNIRNKRSKK